MPEQKSDAYAIVSLAIALLSLPSVVSFFLFAGEGGNVFYLLDFFSTPIAAIVFGVVGLKSSAKKIAKAGIVISTIDMTLKLFIRFVLPIIGVMFYGVG